jgi:hypothetical protein
MAQRIINGEQYEGVFVKGDAAGSAVPITGALRIPEHDYVALGYDETKLTSIAYKVGGASGETVASLILSYDESNNLISVAKA